MATDDKNILKFELNPYQAEFIDSTARFPALIAGIGTGKTTAAILRSVILSERFNNNLGLVVRKEFSDLKDSTMKDFETYTGRKIGSNKEYRFPNGSVIMFRHASEVAVLKNINLGWFYIEQAEEFETEEQFIFLRDRLRRTGKQTLLPSGAKEQEIPYRTGFLIANANGHNWIWRDWLNKPVSNEYFCLEATTFDNERNLTADFIKDLREMERSAPNHYRQYVLNDHNVQDAGDILFPSQLVEEATKLDYKQSAYKRRIIGVDVARFGEDRTVFCVLTHTHNECWKIEELAIFEKLDTMQVTGRLVDFVTKFKPEIVVIDDIGVGGGVVDRMNELKTKTDIRRYSGMEKATSQFYCSKKDQDFFAMRDALENKKLMLPDIQALKTDMSVIRFDFKSSGKKFLISKDELKAKYKVRSPDTIDALNMAFSETKAIEGRINVEVEFGFGRSDRYKESSNIIYTGGFTRAASGY